MMQSERIADLDFLTSYLNTILDHVSQGILFINLQGIVTTYNCAAEDALGVPSDDILNQPFWNHFPNDIFGFSIGDALQTQLPPCASLATWNLPNGHIHHLEVDTSFVITERHKGMIILIRNITSLRELQLMATRSSRMKQLGELAAMIAHEIRNPLGGIKGFATLLQEELKGQEDLCQMAGHIVIGANDLNNFVNKILNYSRPLQVKFEFTDLVALIQELKEHVQADANFNHQIKFYVVSSTPILKAPIDPCLFKSAILNLVVNAIQAIPDSGSLTISLTHDKENAIIEITDTGIGIPKEYMEKLFSPFFTTKATGNGFGLTEVHKVIKAHNGTIEVQSTVNRGTTFMIKIPLKS